MRLIDADALMEVLGMATECEDCKSYDGFFGCKCGSQFAWACEAITDAPTIDPVKRERWCAVAEEMPEPGDWGVSVLVYTVDHEYHVWTAMPYRADNYCWEDDAGYCHDKWEAVFWMPLPEPRKGEEG